MRVLSIGWVILGHTLMNAMTLSILANPNKILDFLSKPVAVIVLSGSFAVDTFFWISGFLVSYLLIIEINSPKKMNWLLIYVHRYLRIVPVYLFVILFSWALQKHMGNGPLWWNEYYYNNDCKKWWWTNILFINNLVPGWKGSNCLGQSWYLSDDMQFFIITPPIIYLYHKYNRYIGWGILTFFIGFSIIISGVIAHHFTLNAVGFAGTTWGDYYDYYYVKPYCRIGVYALGILTGIVVYSYRQYVHKQKHYDPIGVWIGKKLENKPIRFFIGLLGLALINIIIFVQYDSTKHPGPYMNFPHWTHEQNEAYVAFSRFVFGLGLTLLFLPALLGHFTWMAGFLSLDIWTPLARLTFCCYLVQSDIIDMIYHAQTSAVYLDNFLIFKDSTWYFMFCFLMSVPFVLLIEMPALAVEKLTFSSIRAKQVVEDEEKGKSLLTMKDKNAG
ncbi:unnamed protein product [Blepharisma stoltei]|uniref:Acyltransferase 3 domain-containing protein n=1 Tax=Blepharisma stoltei TaxID=1481888 RepID=A0AAU9JB24_9CILI|nr:unnamed protein product [Blepharisma stoltei]